MDKDTFLAALDMERARWDSALAQIDEARMIETGAVGEWSIKDLVAHIAWSEREMVKMLQTHSLRGGSKLWYLSQDERNAVVYAENRERPLAEVLLEAREVFILLRGLLARLEEEDLVDPRRFAGMPLEWTPELVLAGSTYEHYRRHLPALQACAQAQR